MGNKIGFNGWAYDGGLDLARPPTGAVPINSDEAFVLLASIDYGRVLFTSNALPAIRPVNHLIDDGRIVIRARLSSSMSTAAATEPLVVAYEADNIDGATQSGWSVVAAGRAHTLTDAEQVSHYEQILRPWINHADTVMAIEPDVVTGLRFSTEPG